MERERHVEQEFIVDMEARTDTHAAAASDDLKDTLDTYGSETSPVT
jgi:dihydroneopterin aldolase